MSGTYNIVAEQGATFTFNFTVDTNNVVWDLTGYSARMKVKESTASTSSLLSLTSSSEIVLGGDAGTVAVTVDAVTMAAVKAGRWVYDFELESAGGVVTRLLEGRFIVTPEVTN